MFDAVIVGGGVAGLHTAFRLEQAGRRVALCEARGRVGGRLYSAAPEGVAAPLDLGATWIWPHEQRVTALIEELGLRTFPQYEQGALVYDTPTGPQRIVGPGTGGESLRVVGGIAGIADALLDRLEVGTVRLETAATAVHRQDDGALRVDLEGQPPLRARHVVLALPPALAVHRIDFFPDLPPELAQLAAATPVWMGNIVKTVVVYELAFWRRKGLAGTAFSQLGPLHEIHDHSGVGGEPAALFGFTGLRRVGQGAPRRDSIVAQLVRLFGPDAARPLAFVVQDWSRESDTSPPDAVARQSYGLFGHHTFARAFLGGRLHLASCETSGSHGHIEDALAASSRAAGAVHGHLLEA